jgi:putative phosphonate metabolism protein
MATYPRYAIYYAPAPGTELDRFGAQLLGYDAYSGDDLPFFFGEMPGVPPDWHDLTKDPRQYGFHATLKPPLSLADGKTEASLRSACEAFADTPREIPIIRPVIDSISGFIAVVPAEPPAGLIRLAADCVSVFDDARAPLTAEDRSRRNPSMLTARQLDHLDRWGYPYVMEDFRFHMTLTGRLAAERRKTIMAILQERFALVDLGSLSIDRIALFRQNDADSRFRIVSHWKLREGPQAVRIEPKSLPVDPH